MELSNNELGMSINEVLLKSLFLALPARKFSGLEAVQRIGYVEAVEFPRLRLKSAGLGSE